jgi:hypothetical protein
MAWPQPPVSLPESFEVVFERPGWIHRPEENARISACQLCGQTIWLEYGIRFIGFSHWCVRECRTLVIWEAA